MPIRTLLLRSTRLRCPRCGQGKLFRGWFAMHERCDHCHLKFQRAAGYFLGSIYINYGLTALLVIVSYFILYFSEAISPSNLLWVELTFSILFPLWFFRYARSYWLAFDQYFDPSEEGDGG